MIILGFLAMRYNEKEGHWPLLKAGKSSPKEEVNDTSSDEEASVGGKEKAAEDEGVTTKVRSVGSS